MQELCGSGTSALILTWIQNLRLYITHLNHMPGLFVHLSMGLVRRTISAVVLC
jgi:hypothetical protein